MADELPLIERVVVRLLVLDRRSRLLLLHTRDPTYPELGEWWELPGGGVEAGETVTAAALRELYEETGIVAQRESVAQTGWRRIATFRYRGTRRVQHERVVTVRLTGAEPPVLGSHRVGYEDEDYFAHRWWPLPDVVDSAERFYPGRLPGLLFAALAGETIDEPFERWS